MISLHRSAPWAILMGWIAFLPSHRLAVAAPPADGPPEASPADPGSYFAGLTAELRKEWPQNRTIRFVFHGHSVPAGYFKAPVVKRFDSYPLLFHERLCAHFPTATIDVCVTAIGGEESDRGAQRFASDVLALNPDVVLIDYCLNDRRIGLARAEVAWRSMIESCLRKDVLVVLLTPTPDASENLLDDDSPLSRHARQVERLAAEYAVPVADSYAAFRRLVSAGGKAADYLSQSNHPNRAGHKVVAKLLIDLLSAPESAIKKE